MEMDMEYIRIYIVCRIRYGMIFRLVCAACGAESVVDCIGVSTGSVSYKYNLSCKAKESGIGIQ